MRLLFKLFPVALLSIVLPKAHAQKRRDLLTALVNQKVTVAEIKEITLGPNQAAPKHLHPCPVIGYEQRGSGRSAPAHQYTVPLMVSDLEELRKRFALQKIVPLGYSFGASLALEYTLAHPDRVKGLILESFATLQDSAVLMSQMANFYSRPPRQNEDSSMRF